MLGKPFFPRPPFRSRGLVRPRKPKGGRDKGLPDQAACVCPCYQKRTSWKNKSPPKPYLHKFLRKMGNLSKAKASQASSVGPFFFFLSATLFSWAEVHAFEAACLGKPFCSSACLFLLSCRPCFRLTRVCLCFLTFDNLQNRRQVQFHHRVWQPEGFCFKRLFALSFWYAGKIPENDLPCSCSPA